MTESDYRYSGFHLPHLYCTKQDPKATHGEQNNKAIEAAVNESVQATGHSKVQSFMTARNAGFPQQHVPTK